ncbi:MAG: pyridoxal phosphate-dependent aminotransferase [Clostridia bacterium]|nr:pyridoxal phosphate-dependent aminotransferase [Clostridia bacterium]
MARTLSSHMRTIQPSPTVELDARTKALIEAGRDVVNLTAGEPDFRTVPAGEEAAYRAIREGFTKYTPTPGDMRLRRAIAEKLARENGLPYRPEDVVVANGAKQAVYEALLSICDPGDEVILLAPYWVSYAEQVRMAGGHPVPAPSRPEDGFHPRPDEVEAKVGPRTKAIVVNSPNNPTGAVYSEAELRALMEIARRHDLWVISDEIYERLTYDGARHTSPASLGEDAFRRTVVINGASKAFSMTGWRIGYAAASDRDLVRTMIALQTQISSGASSVSQMAALGAFTAPDDAPVREMVRRFDARRRLALEALAAIPELAVTRPEGAFYLFVDVRAYLGHTGGRRFATSAELAEAALDEAQVAVVPGEGFGYPGFWRISYATSDERLEEGLRRLAAWFPRIREATA